MSRIPALTIWRPWTTCILRYGKNVENRSWSTEYRGPLWIHAGKRFDRDALEFVMRVGIGWPGALSAAADDHSTGLVALTTLTGICRPDGPPEYTCGCGPWAVPGEFHWLLGRVRPVTPVQCAGKQGLWWPPSNLTDQAAFEVSP